MPLIIKAYRCQREYGMAATATDVREYGMAATANSCNYLRRRAIRDCPSWRRPSVGLTNAGGGGGGAGGRTDSLDGRMRQRAMAHGNGAAVAVGWTDARPLLIPSRQSCPSSSVSVTGRLHDFRDVLVDLAPSKSKSSSITSLSVEEAWPKRQGGGGGRRRWIAIIRRKRRGAH